MKPAVRTMAVAAYIAMAICTACITDGRVREIHPSETVPWDVPVTFGLAWPVTIPVLAIAFERHP